MHSIVIFLLVFALSASMISLWRFVDYIHSMTSYICLATERRAYAVALVQYFAYKVSQDSLFQKQIMMLQSFEENLSVPFQLKSLLLLEGTISYRAISSLIEITIRLFDDKRNVVSLKSCCIKNECITS